MPWSIHLFGGREMHERKWEASSKVNINVFVNVNIFVKEEYLV